MASAAATASVTICRRYRRRRRRSRGCSPTGCNRCRRRHRRPGRRSGAHRTRSRRSSPARLPGPVAVAPNMLACIWAGVNEQPRSLNSNTGTGRPCPGPPTPVARQRTGRSAARPAPAFRVDRSRARTQMLRSQLGSFRRPARQPELALAVAPRVLPRLVVLIQGDGVPVEGLPP